MDTPDERTSRRRALRFARTCYDHLAGSLGVAITERLVVRKLIAPDGRDVTAEGNLWLRELGIDIEALKARRRTLSRFCLDWSERRDHLAGAMGAAIAATMFERGWLARLPDTRAVRLTLRGRKGLYRALGLEVEPWYRS